MLLGGFVIGSTVEAAYYALINDLYFIPNRKRPAMFYNKTSVSLFGTKDEHELWTRINLMLGLLSKRIAFEDTHTIRVEEDAIKVSTGNTSFKYKFDKVYIFDSTSVQTDCRIKEAKDKTYIVMDDFELSILGPKRYHLEPIIGEKSFPKQLHFYSSDRVDGADYITDCIVESELTEEQLNLFDYSDTMVRFILERHLTSIGVYGRLMEYYKSGKPKYRKPKVVHVKRLVFEKDNSIYHDTERVKFLNLSLESIIEESS